MKITTKKKEIRNKKGINKVYFTYIFEVIYILSIEVLFKYLLNTNIIDWSLFRIIITSNLIAFMLTVITSNINNIIRKIILILANLFIAGYAFIQLGFMNFLGAFMSIGNIEQGTKITDYIMDFIKSYQVHTYTLLIPFIIFIIYIIFEKKILKSGYNKIINFKSKPIILGIFAYTLLLGELFYNSMDLSFMQNKYQSIPNKALYKYPSNPSLAINNFGTSIYFLLDVKGAIKGESDINYVIKNSYNKIDTSRKIDDSKWKKLISEEENDTYKILNDYFINREITDTNQYTGVFKDKNLIMIMLESIGEPIFDSKYKDYFPTLHYLYNEGITGLNNYSPKNNCATGESDMTSQVSLYSIETTCTVNTYRKNNYPEALLSMFQKNGYYTSAYHDYTEAYYYRSVIEPSFGAMKYMGVQDLGVRFNTEYKEWPSDLEFMEKALPNFIDKKKFASMMITVTTHTPYSHSSEWGDYYLDLFDDMDTSISNKRYLSKVKVLDNALDYLIKTLKEKNILDDTVIVLFGDHYPYALGSKNYQDLASIDISVNQDIDRTPFIIYNSEMSRGTIEKVTTPLDYTPTLLNMFGIDFDPRVYAGNDIFSEKEGFALFPDNSWQTDKGFYSSSKGEFITSSSEVDDEYIIKTNNMATELRTMSNLAIKNNYFKYLFDYLENFDNGSEDSTTEKD